MTACEKDGNNGLRFVIADDGLGMSEGTLSRGHLEQVLRGCSMDIRNDGLPLLITGSLYMLGACIEILKNDYAELAFFRGMEPSTNEHR